MFDGTNGWAISSAETYDDIERRDAVEASSLFDLLERHVVPLFYERWEGPVPRQWARRVKSSLKSLGPQVSASRMVRDYVEQLYEPTAGRVDRLSESGRARARALARWKARVRDGWDGVRVQTVDSDASAADLGANRAVSAIVELKGLGAEDIAVQLVHGVVGPNDELHDTTVTPMKLVGLANDHGHYRYEGSLELDRAGRYGFTVRVVPHHDDLLTWAELGRVAWA
jgi:starch phosphorylase